MRKLTQVIIGILTVSALLLSACSKATDEEKASSALYDKVKNNSEYALQEVKISADLAKQFLAEVYDATKSNDKKELRTLGLAVQKELEEKTETAQDKQLLFYAAHYYAVDEMKKELSKDKAEQMVFLSTESVNDEDLRLSLIDIGVVTSLSAIELDEIRDEAVRLLRGKEETKDSLASYRDEIEKKKESLNKVDSDAVSQVFSLAEKEAVNGSKKYPLN